MADVNEQRPFETPFRSRSRHLPAGQGSDDRLLFRSPNYTVRSSWEQVFLQGRSLDGEVTIGDFYGNPYDAAIDPQEQWCVMVGCGVIAYRLRPPWRPYTYDTPTDQWWEFGREPEDTRWLWSVEHDATGRFLLTSAPDGGDGGRRYVLDCSERRVLDV